MDRERLWAWIDTTHIKREFIAGGTAGSVGIAIGFPFDIIKVSEDPLVQVSRHLCDIIFAFLIDRCGYKHFPINTALPGTV